MQKRNEIVPSKKLNFWLYCIIVLKVKIRNLREKRMIYKTQMSRVFVTWVKIIRLGITKKTMRPT